MQHIQIVIQGRTLDVARSLERDKRRQDCSARSTASSAHPNLPLLLLPLLIHLPELSLLTWSRDREISFVILCVIPDAQPMSCGSPIARFILIMRIHSSWIEYERLSSLHVCSSVLIPSAIGQFQKRSNATYTILQIAMDKARLDGPPVRL